jgi:RNA polymerase sigma factor for flagellar operon FliA
MNAQDRDAAVCDLLPLVRSIARRVQRMVPSADLDDVIGDGNVGVLRAVDTFDPARGIPLEQYARRMILGTILNGVRRMDPVSERMRRTMRLAERARYVLAQERGSLPPPCEMERLIPALRRARAEIHRRVPLSLDTSLPCGEQLELDHSTDPQVVVAERLERERIRTAVGALPPRQREIVIAHYFAQKRLRSLIEPLRISPQRVSQLHLMALDRLRAELSQAG